MPLPQALSTTNHGCRWELLNLRLDYIGLLQILHRPQIGLVSVTEALRFT